MSAISMEKCFLSQLLPYDAAAKINGALASGLKEYRALLTAAQRAFTALDQGDLEQFDALVGENACQIRAVKVALIASRDLCRGMGRQVTAVHIKLEGGPFKIKQGISLAELLKTQELDIELSREAQFIVQSFLLKMAKNLKAADAEAPLFRKEAGDPGKLLQLGTITKSFAEKLCRNVRVQLATLSVQFIQESARALQDADLINMSSEVFVFKYKDCWPTLPMFWTYKTLTLTCLREKIPIVLIAKFAASDAEVISEDALLVAGFEVDLTQPACFVQGVVSAKKKELLSAKAWRNIVARRGIEVILAGAAAHRQYPDAAERLATVKNEDYEKYKQLAIEEGYSLNNPSTFFIQHVYAAQLGKIPLASR